MRLAKYSKMPPNKKSPPTEILHCEINLFTEYHTYGTHSMGSKKLLNLEQSYSQWETSFINCGSEKLKYFKMSWIRPSINIGCLCVSKYG